MLRFCLSMCLQLSGPLPEALGEAIVDLARDRARAEAMGRAGRARAEAVFGVEPCVDKYERLYRGVLAGKAPGAIHGLFADV